MSFEISTFSTIFNVSTFTNVNLTMELFFESYMNKVCICMALGILAAGIGGFLQLFMGTFSSYWGISREFAVLFLSSAAMIILKTSSNNGKNTGIRLFYLLLFAFMYGCGMGPLLVHIVVDVKLIPEVSLATCLIFACFSLASMISNQSQRQYIYHRGILATFVSGMLSLSFSNLFIRSYKLLIAENFIGLGVMCSYIFYDIQLIIDKQRNGDEDYIWHSVYLFLDVLHIFRCLLIFFTKLKKLNCHKAKPQVSSNDEY